MEYWDTSRETTAAGIGEMPRDDKPIVRHRWRPKHEGSRGYGDIALAVLVLCGVAYGVLSLSMRDDSPAGAAGLPGNGIVQEQPVPEATPEPDSPGRAGDRSDRSQPRTSPVGDTSSAEAPDLGPAAPTERPAARPARPVRPASAPAAPASSKDCDDDDRSEQPGPSGSQVPGVDSQPGNTEPATGSPSGSPPVAGGSDGPGDDAGSPVPGADNGGSDVGAGSSGGDEGTTGGGSDAGTTASASTGPSEGSTE